MKILSPFTHPQVVPNLYECLCSAEHKWRYSEECGKQSSSGAPLTSIVFFSYYGSQWCPKTAWLLTFFKIPSFVFGRTKTFIQVWNYLRVSKWWQNFHFWVNYPFKTKSLIVAELSYTLLYWHLPRVTTSPSLPSEASCPLKLRGLVPPQIFEPSGFWMQLPKDKKLPNHIFIFDTITPAWLDRSVRQITSS